ncbi:MULTISPECIES: DUF47 family protein [Acidiplasma]|jgi:uncharacterized protein Yka (UPF0111/DUF47 family)|uniref:Phosphate transport regulator n=2 Tax=Acidiplasma TaxID=507753 RepID=A0A0N8VKJ6_9ARCH|nr:MULTISPECIES: DUF47 family protein [Acidiplasma]KJE49615.1 hypothetical protein TZ01_00330 [Acidiplasma sp. MBA-1]KPV47601.1 hypothetical protein SE19_00345 [Acidiplasma aeolicum]KQB33806.1 hypothetical protein AOG54_01620 [Acidiplasma aeolicum]KQB33908.1 hypothetical protein AOG55_01760 [Acidiplasma cupricumulans]WMT55837.1 MAG: DUF47 family protein [Acidiplasma sp.]
MVNYNFLKRLLVVGEKSLLSRLSRFPEIGIESTQNLILMLKNAPVDIDKYNNFIRDKEKEGDEMNINFRHEVTSGAISSSLMDNMLALIEKCDDILDKMYYSSREINRFNKNYELNKDERNIVDFSYNKFISILNNNEEALGYVKNILNETDLSRMREDRKNIEKIEENVDEIKDSIIDYIYKNSNKISYLVFEHLNTLAHKLDDLLDDCEDISDLVFTIMLSVTS